MKRIESVQPSFTGYKQTPFSDGRSDYHHFEFENIDAPYTLPMGGALNLTCGELVLWNISFIGRANDHNDYRLRDTVSG